MGLSTQIVLKVNYLGEFKRISVETGELSFDTIVQHVFFLFPTLQGKPFTIRYQDEEGDLITFSTDQEVAYALEGSNVLRLVITDQDEPVDAADDSFEQVAQPRVRVAAPEVTEQGLLRLSFESAELEVPAQGHLVLFLDGQEIRRWYEPAGTVLVNQLPAGVHEFGVAIATPDESVVSPPAVVQFELGVIAPPAVEPKVLLEPSMLPEQLLKFDIKIEGHDLEAGHALVIFNGRPAAVLKQPESAIVLADLASGKNCLRVQLVGANGEVLPVGGQAEFELPAPHAPASPSVHFEQPAASGDDVLVKFSLADYDAERDGPAAIVLDSRLVALSLETPCTLVLRDLADGQHEVIVELPNRKIENSIRFNVVRPRFPNVFMLQPLPYGNDKLLMRFELDAPLPKDALVNTFINGKFVASFQRQDGCVCIDQPIKTNYTFRAEIAGTDKSGEVTAVL